VLSPWFVVIATITAGIGAVRSRSREYDGWLVRYL